MRVLIVIAWIVLIVSLLALLHVIMRSEQFRVVSQEFMSGLNETSPGAAYVISQTGSIVYKVSEVVYDLVRSIVDTVLVMLGIEV